MSDKTNPVRETDAQALNLAKDLFEQTKYASLAVNERATGYPLVSRVAACWSKSLGLFFAASDLSVHSQCLLVDQKCSLMTGEPGKGDGLAYPRMTIVATTERMPNGDERRSSFRETFLVAHPKAELYIDFADFGFYPLNVERILLNGGFGKAYHLEKNDLAKLNG